MATTEVDEDVDGGPLVGAARTIIEVDEDIDGGPPGRCCREFQQRPPPKLMRMSMAPPWQVLPGGLAAATTEVDEDIDGGPPGRCLILSSIVICSGFCKKMLMVTIDPMGY
jgi:hypothetical protein